MNSENSDRPAPRRDPGTPIYDQLAGNFATPAELTTAGAAAPEARVPEPRAAGDLVTATIVLELFGRMKDLEDSDGSWNGGDTVEALCEWFTQFGIDVDADQLAAARALRVPAWLARTLTAPSADESALVIHVRTDHDRPLETTRAYLSALVWGLGEETSAAVFDVAGDQIAHIVHPAAEPAQL
ncbi:hypothetical protein [Amycolatopsis magusensis]|uniref:hypothetical protein n=1 Tax=Amycolatopsis magusensis TaxID=882444 RepID=UPI0037A094E8